MVHSAGTRRTADETGTSPWSLGTTKSVMPCSAGVTPVAMVVQITGEALYAVRSCAVVPWLASRRRLGSSPSRHIRRRTRHSPPSMPTTTRGVVAGLARRARQPPAAAVAAAAASRAATSAARGSQRRGFAAEKLLAMRYSRVYNLARQDRPGRSTAIPGVQVASRSRAASFSSRLIFVQVFLRHVVNRELARGDLALIRVGRVLDAADHLGLVGLPLFEQLLDAFRTGDLVARQPLDVA